MTNYNRFQGDPAIKLTKNGASMQFIGGQPIMDLGLENAVQISLFTKKGWWGNALLKNDNKKIVSDFQKIRTIVDIQTINDYRDAATTALNWLKKTKLASTVEIVVSNPYNNQIKTDILINPPGQDVNELFFTSNGLNWISQINNPANERFTNAL